MTEQLGKIEKPVVEGYKTGRRLYFVPLIFTPRKPEEEFSKLTSKYWEEVETQLTDLETKISLPNKIYHELVSLTGENGVKIIEELSQRSCQIVKSRLNKGTELHLIEDRKLLAEFMDWSKCLMVGLETREVFDKVYEFYTEVHQRRNRYIEEQIDKTLKENETGILLMQEGHQLQFPQDLQVFYVAPPSLDEIRRWMRTHFHKI